MGNSGPNIAWKLSPLTAKPLIAFPVALAQSPQGAAILPLWSWLTLKVPVAFWVGSSGLGLPGIQRPESSLCTHHRGGRYPAAASIMRHSLHLNQFSVPSPAAISSSQGLTGILDKWLGEQDGPT